MSLLRSHGVPAGMGAQGLRAKQADGRACHRRPRKALGDQVQFLDGETEAQRERSLLKVIPWQSWDLNWVSDSQSYSFSDTGRAPG